MTVSETPLFMHSDRSRGSSLFLPVKTGGAREPDAPLMLLKCR